MIVWTSLGQDGSREGVFGRSVHANNGNASLTGNEFQVNTTFLGQQMEPALASDGVNQFEVVWTSFNGGAYGLDLFAQRYANVAAVLPAMSAPSVYAPFKLTNNVYVPQLQVVWPLVAGISVSNYAVYLDDSSAPVIATLAATTNQWVMGAANGLTTNSTHLFQVGYVTTDGCTAPLSPFAIGTTWSGVSYQGLPVEWMQAYYGTNSALWPANVNAPLLPGNPFTLAQVFLSGGNPLVPGTWLTTAMVKTAEGYFLNWNTLPGQTYQVQESTNLARFTSFGAPRYAAGTNDSVYVGGKPAGYFRVQLVQ